MQSNDPNDIWLCFLEAGNCMAPTWRPSTCQWWCDISWNHWSQALYGGSFLNVSKHRFVVFLIFLSSQFSLCLVESTFWCRSLRSWILTHQRPVVPNFDMPLKGNQFVTCKSGPLVLIVKYNFDCLLALLK